MIAPKDTDKPEGCVVAFTYPNGTGWVGFFIVNEAIRQQGLGRELWKGLEASYKASGTTVIGLDGVEQQVKTYERRGYKDCARIPLMVRPSLPEKPLERHESSDKEFVDLKSVDTKLLAELDLNLTGLDRSALWTRDALLDRKDAFGYALLSPSTNPFNQDQKLLGFVLVRRCEHGHRFGPLYAENYDQAVTLLHRAMKNIEDSPGSMIAEIFGTNMQGRKVFEELGWAWSGLDYHRMWLGGRVPEEQREEGRGSREMFATFDASEG